VAGRIHPLEMLTAPDGRDALGVVSLLLSLGLAMIAAAQEIDPPFDLTAPTFIA